MAYLKLTEKPKATAKLWFSRLLRHPSNKLSGSVSDTKHTHLFIYLFILYRAVTA